MSTFLPPAAFGSSGHDQTVLPVWPRILVDNFLIFIYLVRTVGGQKILEERQEIKMFKFYLTRMCEIKPIIRTSYVCVKTVVKSYSLLK